MKKLVSTLFTVLFIATLQSCASASFQIPNNRFQSPETSGGFGNGLLAVGHGSKTTVILADGAKSTDEAILAAAKVKTSEGIFMQTALGLHRRFDFLFYNGAGGLKFQALGSPATEAKAGNTSLAFGLAGDRGANENSTYGVKTRAEYTGIDSMILFGHRVQDNQLLYGNLTYSNFTANGSIVKESNSEAGAVISTTLKVPKRTARETSLLLGWQGYSNQAYLMFETGYTFAGLEGKNSVRRLALGGTLGVRW
jgi:hypothetical protein